MDTTGSRAFSRVQNGRAPHSAPPCELHALPQSGLAVCWHWLEMQSYGSVTATFCPSLHLQRWMPLQSLLLVQWPHCPSLHLPSLHFSMSVYGLPPLVVAHFTVLSPAELHVVFPCVHVSPPLDPLEPLLPPVFGQSELKVSAFAMSSQLLPSKQVIWASVMLFPQSCPQPCETAFAGASQDVIFVWHRELQAELVIVGVEPELPDVPPDEPSVVPVSEVQAAMMRRGKTSEK